MINNHFKYYNPVKIFFGQDEIKKLKRLVNNRKVLLLCCQYFRNTNTFSLINNDINAALRGTIDFIKPNPTFNELEKHHSLAWEKEFEVIVAIGGGSVIDTAKVLSLNHQKFSSIEGVIKGKDPYTTNLKPIISIPTTSGTGSEVTPWATVWDDFNKKKYSLHLPSLWSEYSILDPKLTLSAPKDLTIRTALDALSHSIESIWNINANPISTNYSKVSVNTIIETLPLLKDDLENIELREKMMFASLNAGLAFSNTQTSISHALSYYMTLNNNIVHGIASSFTIPFVMKFIEKQDSFVTQLVHETFGEGFINRLQKFFEDIAISTDFKDYGITHSDAGKIQESILSNQRANNFPHIKEFLKYWTLEWDLK